MASFFAKATCKFQPLSSDQRIATNDFLNACSEIVPFFDVIGPTAFKPVKSDISGNIEKLKKKYSTDPVKFKTLQDIVESEIESGTTKSKNSSTDALLWLKRALTFIRIFLREVLDNEQDLVKCARTAYEESLKRYHGWMVQGIFSLAVKAVPYRKDFILALGPECTEEQVLSDMRATLTLMGNNLDVINEFYVKTGQDATDKV